MLIDIVKVFGFAIMIDVMWVLYILATSQKKRVFAAICSVGIGAPALFGTLEVVKNVWLSIPYLLGLGIGTFVGMELHERFIENNKNKEEK